MFHPSINMPDLYKAYARKLVVAVMAVTLAFLAWSNVLFRTDIDANAATIQNSHLAVTAEGIGDKIEGKVQEDIGTVQRNVGEVTGQAEGALKQAKGKAKQDVGTVKNQLDDAQEKAEDASESLVDSVRDFFN